MLFAHVVQRSLQGIRTGAVVAAVFMAGAFLAAALSLLVPREVIIQRIADGFESADLVPVNRPRSEHWRLGRDQWTDCATFQMSIRGEASVLRETITPRRLRTVPPSPCPALQDYVSRPGAEVKTWRYHQYIHGTTTLTRFALGLGSVRKLRTSIKAVLLILVAVVVIGTFARIRAQAGRTPLNWALFVLAIAFAATLGLHQHAASVSHGVTAGVLLLGFAVFVLLDLSRLSPDRLNTLAASFGALTAIMEWLDGGSPMGLALILGILGLYALSAAIWSDREDAARLYLGGWSAGLAFTTAVVSCFIIKITAATILYGWAPARRFIKQFLHWAGPGGSISETVNALMNNLDVVGLGSKPAGELLVVLALILGVTALVLLVRVVGRRSELSLIVASAVVVPLWFLLFRNHAIQHAWFMARLLAWPTALGFALFAFWLAAQREHTLRREG